MKSKPKAVLISDIHFHVNTLELASCALRQAVAEAENLNVPLIIAGDLNDTKAILRAECANVIIKILDACVDVPVFVMVGNHDLINEKAKEHSLNFLRPYVNVIQEPVEAAGFYFIPYRSTVESFQEALSKVPEGSIVIMHQGVKGVFMGEYAVDKSSIDPKELAKFRCISGHYHRHQNIICDGKKHASNGETGVLSYIGSPYTMSFAEANDGPKGFQVLMTDGTLKQVETNLRKHVIVARDVENVLYPIEGLNPRDKLWLQVKGSVAELHKLSKKEIGLHHLGHQDFKLDKIPNDIEMPKMNVQEMTNDQILDKLIEASEEPADFKKYLKKLWREVL